MIIASKKRARFDYEIIDTEIAGIVLEGSEIKSLRRKEATLTDAFVIFRHQEAYLINCHITPYKFATIKPPAADRTRKLLLTKRQLRKWNQRAKEERLLVIPLNIFFNPQGLVKVKIALARPKKLYDKRQAIKERAVKRELKQKYHV